MHRGVKLVVATASLAGALVAGIEGERHGLFSDVRWPPTGPVASPPAAVPPPDSTAAPVPPASSESSSPAPVAAGSPAPTAPETPEPFRFRRASITNESGETEACLSFTSPLDETGTVRYRDYLTLPAELKPGLRVDATRLCLSGLTPGSTVPVGLRPGLPAAAAGQSLTAAQTITLTIPDRPPIVAFGPGFLLPREMAEGLPVNTVNVRRLEVKVHRVGDRLLARFRQDMIEDRSAAAEETRRLAEEDGREIWSGTVPVAGIARNQNVTTLLPLAEVIGRSEPGAYLVTARNPDAGTDEDGYAQTYSDPDSPPDYIAAAQWVVVSDLGLSSFSGADGLTVTVRSLKTAQPVAGVTLTLIARGNDELARQVTDREGKAHFDPGLMRGLGGMVPVMVMAYAGADYAFSDLRRPQFDLSDRGVEGRAPAGPVDAFLYTERGIYRPGETLHLAALLRDPKVNALDGRRVTLKVKRPNEKDYRQFEIAADKAGGGTLDIPLPATANRGTWEITAHTEPAGPPVGRVSFEVQDFVPQRLGLTLGAHPAFLKPDSSVEIPLEARFLYGAVAAGLGVEGEVGLEVDPNPFPRHKGYRWGLEEETVKGERTPLEAEDTDPQGHAVLSGALPAVPDSTKPLRAEIAVAVREPGGRATSEHLYLPVRNRAVALGLHPRFEDSVGEGQEAQFDLIAVNEAGEQIARTGLEYRVLRDVSTWQWFRSGGSWRYQQVKREAQVGSGRIAAGTEAPALLKVAVKWGQYRLEVRDPTSGAATSLSFTSGWYATASADRPDRLKLAADKAGYQPGETARLHVDAPSGGQALLVIANERVQETRNITLPPGGGDIPVVLREEWGPGAYALVTLYRPLSEKLGHAPVRAVGVAWLGLDPGRRTLKVAIDAPERLTPRQTLSVPVRIEGGTSAFVTLAAVDQGILQLTRFKSPSPTEHYLSQRRLGVDMRDDYGRLIRAQAGKGEDEGGDAFGGKGLDVVPTRTVALFSGLVSAGPDGTATIPLEIPDFQGELRLMAVAFDGSRIGSADRRMVVRDPVVAEVILPRFLAPGDQGRATVLLHDIEGGDGTYAVSLRPDALLGGEETKREIALEKGKRTVFTLPITATTSGIGGIDLTVSGPDGFAVSRSWPLQVRAAQLPLTRQTVQAVAPGESITLNRDLLADYVPGSGRASVSLSRFRGLDVPGLLRWLDRYPFGCLEQITSRALPLLYFNDVAQVTGARQDQGLDERLREAVETVAGMQGAEGGFNQWGQWGGEADPWLSVFALDFLERAADKGLDVPNGTLTLGRHWLARAAVRDSRADVHAYAVLLLARRGQANAADLRYFFDTAPPKSPLALAQLGAALETVGERARAAAAFDAAQAALTAWTEAERKRDGAVLKQMEGPAASRLRDAYGVAALLAAHGRAARIPAVLASVDGLEANPDATTTQEKAWMLLAAAEMARVSGHLGAEIDGKALTGSDPLSLALSPEDLARGLTVKSTAEGQVFRIVSTEGVPAAPLPAGGNGAEIRKSLYSLSGQKLDSAKVQRNERMVVVIDGSAGDRVPGDYGLIDLLPAGWEIEGLLRPEQPGYEWLGRLSEAESRQARDDRFVAALRLPDYEMDRSDPSLGPQRKEDTASWTFRIAYVVRAVSPGIFALPAARIDHMTVPRIQARSAFGQTEVVE